MNTSLLTKMIKLSKAFNIMLLKVSGYAKSFDGTKCMSIFIKNDQLLKNTITFLIKSEVFDKKDLIA